MLIFAQRRPNLYYGSSILRLVKKETE